MKYNFSKLWSEQFLGFYQFKDFYEYASNKEFQAEYYKRLGAVGNDEEGNLIKIETPQALIDASIESNEETLEMIKNQVIVFLFTRYEFVIQDTMKCLICDKPERILDFIKAYPAYKDSLGFTLTEFMKYESKEKYVSVMSERLSSKVLSGKPSKVIQRLKCLLSFENIDTDVLDDLMVKRNRIVHDGTVHKLRLDELEIYYEAIENLLKTLALALRNINIAIVDNGGLLKEPPF